MRDMGSVSRSEMAVLGVLLLAGLGLRVWGFGSTGIDHFDEAVYAFSALSVAGAAEATNSGGGAGAAEVFPGQHRFSPPVYFSLVGAVSRLTGVAVDRMALLVNMILGTLTIAAVWWAGRNWFGPAPGMAGAALLAFNEYHIALSRTALSDVAFALFFLIAVWLILTALDRLSLRWAIVAGLAVGLAWGTKYHGWLAQAIVAGALIPILWSRRGRNDSNTGRVVILWFVITLVAIVCYLPWALYVESQPGGYADLMAYQRTMLRSTWLDNLVWQIRLQEFLDGPLTRAAPFLAVLAAGLYDPGWTKDSRLPAGGVLVVVALVFGIGGAGAAVLLAFVALPLLVRPPWRLTAVTLLAWLVVWLVLTPLYQPYARLVLPVTIAVCLGGGVGLVWLLMPHVSTSFTGPAGEAVGTTGRRFGAAQWTLAGVALLIAAASTFLPDYSNPWRRSDGMREATKRMAEVIPPGSVVATPGEPSAAYYLNQLGRIAPPNVVGAQVPELLESVSEPAYVVFGLYTRYGRVQDALVEELGDRFVFIGSFELDVKDIRLLDDSRTGGARAHRTEPSGLFDLRLYRYDPAGEDGPN
jgi:4-amino-4-deoxy-L-arabinose transferase-like glycosyltransferase